MGAGSNTEKNKIAAEQKNKQPQTLLCLRLKLFY